MQSDVIVVLDNIRSGHNVGSLMRTCDGLGASKLYLCGITPHPRVGGDQRPEHVIRANTKEINKTALGAQEMVAYEYSPDAQALIPSLQDDGYKVYCLENNVTGTKSLKQVKTSGRIALVLGSETDGIGPGVLSLADEVIEIPMHGQKNSLNVSVAGGIALFQLLSAQTSGRYETSAMVHSSEDYKSHNS